VGGDVQEQTYTMVDNDLFDDNFISGQEKWLLIVLIRYWNSEKEYAYPSYETLMEKADMSKATLRKHLVNLELKNYIKIIKHRGKTVENNTYKISKYLCLKIKLSENEEKSMFENNQSLEIKPSQSLKTKLHKVQKLNRTNTIYTNTNNIYTDILEYWNDKKIIVHKKITNDIQNAISKALKNYSNEEIVQAIDIYSEILRSDFYFNHKWSLKDFLNRRNGISTFMEDGTNKCNYDDYLNKQIKTNKKVWGADN
jgi:hypothetical protein